MILCYGFCHSVRSFLDKPGTLVSQEIRSPRPAGVLLRALRLSMRGEKTVSGYLVPQFFRSPSLFINGLMLACYCNCLTNILFVFSLQFIRSTCKKRGHKAGPALSAGNSCPSGINMAIVPGTADVPKQPRAISAPRGAHLNGAA